MNSEVLKKEQEKLDLTIEEISEILEEQKMRFKVMMNQPKDDDVFWNLVKQNEIHIENLEYSIENPYFARIDFTDDESGLKQTLYIGKNGIMKDAEMVVTDWRAPISSLYYDSELGECSYHSPKGEISGILDLKRQYEIENKKIIEYFDVDLVSRDDLLQKYLNSNNEARLKSIVSTIQKEQNDAIRKSINENIIVQGVAGSGKTTVALHRIAYLVYNYMKKIRQDQYMVIGPNPVFLKYIKAVLPELDVSGVEQKTYEQFAMDYTGSDLTINSSEEKVAKNIKNAESFDVEKIKSSIHYMHMLDKFLEVYIHSIITKDLTIGDFKILDKSIMQEVFEKTNSNYKKLSIKDRIDLTVDRLCNIIEESKSDISHNYSNYTSGIFNNVTKEEEKEKLRNKFGKDREELDKNCRGIIRKYFSRIKYDSIKVYSSFISSIGDFNIYNYDKKVIDKLKKETLSNLKSKKCDYEDLPSLIYLKTVLNPDRFYSEIRHTVIDEAQDLGEFNFMALKSALPNSTFSVFGDLAQSIYDYRSIKNWDIVNQEMFDEKGKVIYFRKSYRTTAEIMDLADTIADSVGFECSETVVRHGVPVSVTKVSSNEEISDYIISKILEFKEKGYKSIAIISKTDEESKKLNETLKRKGTAIPNIKMSDNLLDEDFKICTISNQLAKGLEFDAVIINNATENVYSSDSNLDMKLLYVATTRALHELEVVYDGKLTKPVADHEKKKSKTK